MKRDIKNGCINQTSTVGILPLPSRIIARKNRLRVLSVLFVLRRSAFEVQRSTFHSPFFILPSSFPACAKPFQPIRRGYPRRSRARTIPSCSRKPLSLNASRARSCQIVPNRAGGPAPLLPIRRGLAKAKGLWALAFGRWTFRCAFHRQSLACPPRPFHP